MSEYVYVTGEAFDGAPAFTLKTKSCEMKALLLLSCDANMVLVHVGSGEFFLRPADGGKP